MEEDLLDFLLYKVPILFVLYFIIALSNAIEVALRRASTSTLKEEAANGRFGANRALFLIENIETSSATVRTIMVAGVVLLGWSANFLVFELPKYLGSWDLSSYFVSVGGYNTLVVLSAMVVVFTVVFLNVVFGEILASCIGVRFPEFFLRFFSGLVLTLVYLLRPITYLQLKFVRYMFRSFGIEGEGNIEKLRFNQNIAELVSANSELDEEEEDMLRGVFNFSTRLTKEVMTPRTNISTIPVNATLQEVLEVIKEDNFSRYPVIGDNRDDVKGILIVKDLLRVLSDSDFNSVKSSFNMEDVMREAFFVPSTKPVGDLLDQFKLRKYHMAVVLDEHGGVDGLVTLEDILEEIVGDIFDESDDETKEIEIKKDGHIYLDGGVLVNEVNDQFGLSIPVGEYDTIAGFIFSHLGRIPEAGEKLALNQNGFNEEVQGNNLEAFLQVEQMDGNRIERVKLSFQ